MFKTSDFKTIEKPVVFNDTVDGSTSPYLTLSDFQIPIEICSILYTFINLLNFLICLLNMEKIQKKIGIYVIAFGRAVKQSLGLLPILSILLAGFSFSFYLRSLVDSDLSYFNSSTPFVAFITKPLTLMVGDYQSDKMGVGFEETKPSYSYFFNSFIYIMFVYLICILFLNLFTGIAIGELTAINR